MQTYAPATRNSFGKGWGYYVGVFAKEESFYDKLMFDVLCRAGIRPPVQKPSGVEVSVREGDGKKLLFLINHLNTTHEVAAPAGKLELLRGSFTTTTLQLERYDVAVLKL